MKPIDIIELEEEERQTIVRRGLEITEIAKKFWDGENLSKAERYLLAKSAFWLGKDMKTRSSRYIPKRKAGSQKKYHSLDILLEYYSLTLIEGKNQAQAFNEIMESYEISDGTIKNMIKEDGEGVKAFFFDELKTTS